MIRKMRQRTENLKIEELSSSSESCIEFSVKGVVGGEAGEDLTVVGVRDSDRGIDGVVTEAYKDAVHSANWVG